MKFIALIVFCCLISISFAQLYVSPFGSDVTGTGSQSKPFQTFMKAYNSSIEFGTIYALSGIYAGPDDGFTVEKNINFTSVTGNQKTIITAGFKFVDGITVAFNGFTFSSSYSSSINLNNIENTNIIVVNCAFNGFEYPYFPIYIYSSTGTVNVIGSTFNTNEGAISCYSNNGNNIQVVVNGCSFLKNSCNNGYGGAIYSYGCPLQVFNSDFTSNQCQYSSGQGGAISISGSSSIMSSNTFTSNNAYDGGAIYCDNSATVMIEDTSFISNTANMAAIADCGESCVAFFNNCIFQGNKSSNKQNGTCTFSDEVMNAMEWIQ